MIATWIPDTTNGARSFVVFLVIESRMSGGPSHSHVTAATQEMPRRPRGVNSSSTACFTGSRLAICRFGHDNGDQCFTNHSQIGKLHLKIRGRKGVIFSLPLNHLRKLNTVYFLHYGKN